MGTSGRIPEGELLLRNALAAAREFGLRRREIRILSIFGMALALSDDLGGARLRYREALGMAQSTGAETLATSIATNLAEVEFQSGDAPAALQMVHQALEANRARNDVLEIALALCNASAYLIALGRYEEAHKPARDALMMARDTQFGFCLVFAPQHLAALAALRPADEPQAAQDDRIRAARLLGYVDARMNDLELCRGFTEQQEYDKMLPVLRIALGEDEVGRLMQEGVSWDEDRAVEEALQI